MSQLVLGFGKRRINRRLPGRIAGWACCLLVATLVSSGQPSLADDETVVAIVHPDNPVSMLSLHDVRLMYGLYRRVWSSGSQVQIVLPLPGSPAMDFVVDRVFRRMDSVVDVDRFYLEALFQQRIGRRPEQLSARATLVYVRSVRGAVALLDRSVLSDEPGVRVVEIGGPRASRFPRMPVLGAASQAASRPASAESGRQTRKVEPPTSGFSTSMVPAWARAISIARGRPSPSEWLLQPSPR